MRLKIADRKGNAVSEGMIGLFFEDINYAADGGLYAEMLENRSFEFVDCYGDKGDYYTKPAPGYGWSAEGDGAVLEFVTGSPLYRENPHYLRFTADREGAGFKNKAYRGIYLRKGEEYRVSFYARMASYTGNFTVCVKKGDTVSAKALIEGRQDPADPWHKWIRYEAYLEAREDVDGADFVLSLDGKGIVEFDFISMMPADAVAGVFRKDLFECLKGLHPGFLRFPGGCIVEGDTLENRYRWKESVGAPEARKSNFNRWAVHGTTRENGWHTEYSHYNQTLGIGFYEYFLLCEMIGAKPLPVLNVGLACQYQSYELVEPGTPEFGEFIQDALDLIEFANGSPDTFWGGVRARMGHEEPFGLSMVGIGNEQWQTKEADFFTRYRLFEKAIHEKYPEIKLIGSAGPDIISDHYRDAWSFYRQEGAENENFCYAVDEHYYVKPEWFYDHVDFYDEYPRDVKVFSGEYAAHPENGMNNPAANTLKGALSEAAFLTGVERNADVVILASYAPLFARLGYAQWSPDLIWFDENGTYPTASYYVQKMYGENMGTVTIPMEGQEKALAGEAVYVNVTLDEKTREYIVKAVNAGDTDKSLEITDSGEKAVCGRGKRIELVRSPEAKGWDRMRPEPVAYSEKEEQINGVLVLPAESFTVLRIPAGSARQE
ncbi:MAG: alpha-L-arabinofuranosidase [Lachnospiraceae bacterium]|nr:alpha-L-arabinofuranosidase [Lachnospiraceae bacterium]